MMVLNFLASLYLLLGIGECLNLTEHYADAFLKKRQLRSVSEVSALSKEVLTWTCPMKESYFVYLSEQQKWYTFLNSLFCVLSTYEIQVAKSNYNVYDLQNWGKPNDATKDAWANIDINKQNQEHGIKIDRNNLETFLNKIAHYNIAQYDSIKNAVITEFQLEELNQILTLTIKQGLHISCENNHLSIKGHYIIVSQINTNIVSGKIDKNCIGKLFTKELKFFNIFALNTLFIDADMPILGIGEPMTIIAPKWHIIGSRKIDFNGKDADPQPRKVFSSQYYMHGADGKPGKPGRPGGNFFGIGDQFINGENLVISANGGNGSPGQEGENGRNGNDGITPTVPLKLSCDEDLCNNDKKINLFRCKLFNCYYQWNTPALTAHFSPPIRTSCSFKMFGESGREGGNGGNGGKGGAGGIQGKIEVFELNGYSGISKISKSGQNGTDGPGGTGGLGGKRGNDIIANCKFHNDEWSLINTIDSYERAKSGQNGLEGANSKDMEIPELSTSINNLDKSKIINQYKSYSRENLNNRFTYYILINFLRLLENDSKVKNIYNTLGFIDELQSLEKHFHTLNEDINLLPFYQSLLNRISEYARYPAEDVNPILYKKIIGYLYTATLGRIYNLEDDLESNLIIDITSYLDSVKNDIEKLKHFQNSKIKEEVINKYKQEYKNKIDTKIKEAIDVITKDITPEIDKIGADIDAQMESLITEVTNLKQKTREEQEILTAKQQELGKVLVFQNVVSSVKIFGQVLSFLGPVGAAVGSVIGIGGTVAETFIFNTPGFLNSTAPLTQSVKDLESLKDQIKRIREQKVSSLKTTLEVASEEANKYPDTFSEVSVKISDFRSRLDKVSRNSANIQEIQDLEIEIKTTLQTQTRQLSNAQESSNNQNKQNELVAIQKVQTAIQLSSVILDAYNKHKLNEAKLEAINGAIKQNENKFIKLKQYEDKFYSTIIPMLQTVLRDIDSLIYSLDRKSKVALDVAKWKIKNTLEDMILQVKEITQEFKVESNLARCIEKIKDAMVMLIIVHDHIRDFQKDQNFVDLIADINAITVSRMHPVYNPKLESDFRFSLRDLEIAVRSSIVVQRHKVAIDAFKQFVFPFADYYFKGLILPTHLKLNNDKKDVTLDNLVFRAVFEIQHLKLKLEEYKETVRRRDGCIGTGIFKSDYVSSQPFFVWRNEDHQTTISKLFSGEAVTVKADIKDSVPNKDAIKFNVIAFNFRSKDGTKQYEINHALKGFQINATHLGDSYYRYGNNFYLMTTPSQNIWFTFEKSHGDEPIYKSSSYDKIRKGDFTLSPYASWKIKLDSITDNASFRDLERYLDQINMELGGYGYYVNKKDEYCSDLNVDRYYKSINAYDVEDSRRESYSPSIRDESFISSVPNQNKAVSVRGSSMPFDQDETDDYMIPLYDDQNGDSGRQSYSPSFRNEGIKSSVPNQNKAVSVRGSSMPFDQDETDDYMIPLYDDQNGDSGQQSYLPSLRDDGLKSSVSNQNEVSSMPLDQDDIMPLYDDQNVFYLENDETQLNEGTMDFPDYVIPFDNEW